MGLEHVSVFFERLVTWISGILVALTAVGSLLVTVTYPLYDKTIVFDHNPLPALVFSALIFALFLVLHRTGALAKMKPVWVGCGVAIWTILAGLVWISVANAWPEFDAFSIMQAGREMHDIARMSCPDSPLCPGGYLEAYPFQIPVAAFSGILSVLFGSHDYLAFEICNILATAALFMLLGIIAHQIFYKQEIINLALLLCALFVPQIMYATFAYGNTIGLAFAAAALSMQISSLQSTKWGTTIAWAAGSLAALFLAIFFKSSYMYVAAAMMLIYLLSLLRKRNWIPVVCAVIVALAIPFSSLATTGLAHAYDLRTDRAKPQILWVAMGLHHPDKMPTNNFGFYDGSVSSFADQGLTSSQISHKAKNRIKQSLRQFASSPSYTLEFFSKKFAADWLDPTYESFLVSNWSKEGAAHKGKLSDRPMTRLQKSCYYGRTHDFAVAFMDGFQLLLLVGAAWCLIACRKQLTMRDLAIPVVWVGMFVLYTVWETQSQYILPAYLLIVPYAAAGIEGVFGFAASIVRKSAA